MPCAVMSTMVFAVSAEVGGSTPSAQGAAAWGAAGPLRRLRRECNAIDGSDEDDDDVEGAAEIDDDDDDDAASLDVVAAALGTTAVVEELLEAAFDATRALNWAARADIGAKAREKREN